MGRVKEDMLEQYELEQVGAEILIRAKLGIRCPVCEEFICEETDYTDAYKLGNYLFTQGDPLVESFESRQEMTNAIKRAGDNAPYECGNHEITITVEAARNWSD